MRKRHHFRGQLTDSGSLDDEPRDVVIRRCPKIDGRLQLRVSGKDFVETDNTRLIFKDVFYSRLLVYE